MWKVTQYKTFKSKQDIQVSLLVKELAQNTYATISHELENHFKERLSALKKNNAFAPELMYRLTRRNLKSAEVWKLYPNGVS